MTITSPLHVLVSGGGIAGNAVALQLLRNGIRTTVVERAAAPAPAAKPSICAARARRPHSGWA